MKVKTTPTTMMATDAGRVPDPLDVALTEQEATLAAQRAAGEPLFAAHMDDSSRAFHTSIAWAPAKRCIQPENSRFRP